MPNQKKSRILYLLKYLNDNTDENNPVSTRDIMLYLNSIGINAHKDTVFADIDMLLEYGIDIIKIKSSPNKFFIGERRLEFPELKLLVDAVQSSCFITPKKSEILIEKLSRFSNTKKSELLMRELFIDKRTKQINEKIYYIVDTIYKAIKENCMITFKYFEYTPEKKKVHKHNGYKYQFSPYTLYWNDDHYYIIGYSNKHSKIVNFRVDRMDDVSLVKVCQIPKPESYNPTEYTYEIFNMYGGRQEKVVLKCVNSLMDVIIDRFGKDVETEIMDDENFKATVSVSASPTFFAWIYQFGGRVKILSPFSVREQMVASANQFMNEFNYLND